MTWDFLLNFLVNESELLEVCDVGQDVQRWCQILVKILGVVSFFWRTVPANLRETAKSSHFLFLKASEQICTGFFFPLVSAKPTFTWIVRLQIFRLGCKSTIHLVCVMTGPGVSCVILSSTAQSCDAPPPSWLQPWWSLLVLLLQTCWVILENYDRQSNGFCRMHFIF